MDQTTEQELKRRIKELEDRVDALCLVVSKAQATSEQHVHAFDVVLAGINRQRRDEINTW